MASFNRVTFSGSTDTISVPFGYLDKSHVTVTLDGVVLSPSLYSWLSSGQIKLLGGNPASGTIGEARRITPPDPLVDFEPGNLDANDLDTANIQGLYLSEEAKDLNSDSNEKITYLYAAVNGQLTELNEAVSTALSAQSAAASSEANSAASELNASLSESNAAQSASIALDAKSLAQIAQAGASASASTATNAATSAQSLVTAATAGFLGFQDGLAYDWGSVVDTVTYFDQDWGGI